MSSAKAEDFPLLLEVFRGGLARGLVSKDEIVAWADSIIAIEDEPDYFFIELSLSSDVNGLVEVLNKYVKPTKTPICERVILGLIYHRQPIFDIDEVEKIATLVGGLYSWDVLTSFENNTILNFEEYYPYYFPDLTQLQVELNSFLDLYKAFTLENFEQWGEINGQVLELLKAEEIEVNIVNESLRKAWAKKEKKIKLTRLLKKVFAIVGILCIVIILILSATHDSSLANEYYFALAFIVLRWGYRFWWKRKKN